MLFTISPTALRSLLLAVLTASSIANGSMRRLMQTFISSSDQYLSGEDIRLSPAQIIEAYVVQSVHFIRL
jgi:hypothetical protein